MLDQISSPYARLFRFRQVLAQGLIGTGIHLPKRNVAQDGRENVVEIMSYPAGEHAKRLELAGFDELFLHLPLLGDVAESQHQADYVALAVLYRSRVVADGSLSAVPGDQMVGEADCPALIEYFFHRAVASLASLFVKQQKDIVQAFARSVSLGPASELFRDIVDQNYPALPVGGNCAVADGPKGDCEPLLALPQRSLHLHVFGDVVRHAAHDGRGHSLSAQGVVVFPYPLLPGTGLNHHQPAGHPISFDASQVIIEQVAALGRQNVADASLVNEVFRVITHEPYSYFVHGEDNSLQVMGAYQIAAMLDQISVVVFASTERDPCTLALCFRRFQLLELPA